MKQISLLFLLFGFANTHTSNTQKETSDDKALDILFYDPARPYTPTTGELVAVLGFPKHKPRSTSTTPPTSPTKEKTEKQATAPSPMPSRFFFTRFAPQY